LEHYGRIHFFNDDFHMADGSAPRVPVAVDSLYPTADALGAHPFEGDLLARYESVAHRRTPHLIRRGIFNAQIDFSDAVSRTESGRPFYILLSLTPTNRLFHLRHIVVFQLAKELQDALNCFVVVHVLDTKACLRDPESKWESAKAACDETIRDVLSFEFNPSRTVVIANSNAFSLNYVYLCDLQRRTPLGSFFDPFFADDQVSIGLVDAVYQNVCFTIPRYLEKIFPNFAEMRCLPLLRPSQMNTYEFATRRRRWRSSAGSSPRCRASRRCRNSRASPQARQTSAGRRKSPGPLPGST
jgi:hypothetical protein